MTAAAAAEGKEKTAETPAFDKLIAEIGEVHKALPTDDTAADDKKIEAAAGEDDEDGDEDDEKEEVTKSYTIKLDDGTEVTAVDGTEMLKALNERVEKNEGVFKAIAGQLLDIVKSLEARVAKLSNTGKGRKAVLTVTEKPVDISKAKEAPTETAEEFFAKALVAQAAGKLNGIDISRAEAALNQRKAIPADILRRVYGN